MKKVLLLGLALLVFTANVFAKGQASLWGGYTTVCMEDLNDKIESEENNIKKAINYAKSQGSVFEGNVELSEAKDAFIVGVDYLFDINENVKVGPRAAFLQAKKLTLEISGDVEGGVNDGGSYEAERSIDTRLVPIMFGGSYNINISEKFSLIGKLFLGYGLINVKDTTQSKRRRTGDDFVEVLNSIKASTNTGCFMWDISMGAQYLFTKRFGLGLDIGYRFTPVTKVKMKYKDSENSDQEFPKEALKLDFSGLTTKLSLSYKI